MSEVTTRQALQVSAMSLEEAQCILDVLNSLETIRRHGFAEKVRPYFVGEFCTCQGREGMKIHTNPATELGFFVHKLDWGGEELGYEIIRLIDNVVQESVWAESSPRFPKHSVIAEVDDPEVAGYLLQSLWFYESMRATQQPLYYGDDRDADNAGAWDYLSHLTKLNHPFVGCMPPLGEILQIQLRSMKRAPDQIDVVYGIMAFYVPPGGSNRQYGVLIFPDDQMREPSVFDMRMVKAWRVATEARADGNTEAHSITDLVDFMRRYQPTTKVITNG